MMDLDILLGLCGEDIPYLARIVAIADTFDAMTSKRPYRDALTIDSVKSEFAKFANAQFDPKLAHIFFEMLNNPTDLNNILEIQGKY